MLAQFTPVRVEQIRMRGGLDLSTPPFDLKPGYLRDALNFECAITGGYARIGGYERHDGRPNPSDAVYLTITVAVTGAVAVGNTINGLTSSATGVVTSIEDAPGSSDKVIAFTKATGAFQDGETVRVVTTAFGTISDIGGGTEAPDYDVTQKALAAAVYRADIAAVPGSGAIRGVAQLGSITYAWRDNAGGTALAVYKSSASGWTLVPFYNELAFTTGTSEYSEGETVSQGGVSATIKRVCLQSGTWSGGNAAGRLIITNPTGGNFAAGAIAGGGAATASGAQTAITMQPGGRVETDTGNFGIGTRLYGCDGVNRGWEFDGDTLAPITTGNSPDAPSHVMVHKDHLLLSFADSLQGSGIGAPFNWTTVAGAFELNAKGLITVMLRLTGDQSTGAAAVFTELGLNVLYGSSAANFQFVPFEDSAGARAYSGQRLGQVFTLDDRGVFSMGASQAFGNFAGAALTLNIAEFIAARRNLVSASVVHREKSQYRLFFSDGFGLYVTIANNKLVGCMPVSFPNKVTCACTAKQPNGAETSFFGSDNGFVYRLDAGTSFDGAAIPYLLLTGPMHQGDSRALKRYRRAALEVQGKTYARFSVAFELGYGEQFTEPITPESPLSPAFFDAGGSWDVLTWDGKALAPAEVDVTGTDVNIAMRVFGEDHRFGQFTLNSTALHYQERRRLR